MLKLMDKLLTKLIYKLEETSATNVFGTLCVATLLAILVCGVIDANSTKHDEVYKIDTDRIVWEECPDSGWNFLTTGYCGDWLDTYEVADIPETILAKELNIENLKNVGKEANMMSPKVVISDDGNFNNFNIKSNEICIDGVSYRGSGHLQGDVLYASSSTDCHLTYTETVYIAPQIYSDDIVYLQEELSAVFGIYIDDENFEDMLEVAKNGKTVTIANDEHPERYAVIIPPTKEDSDIAIKMTANSKTCYIKEA